MGRGRGPLLQAWNLGLQSVRMMRTASFAQSTLPPMGDPLRNGTVNSQPSGHLALGTGHMLHARVSLPYFVKLTLRRKPHASRGKRGSKGEAIFPCLLTTSEVLGTDLGAVDPAGMPLPHSLLPQPRGIHEFAGPACLLHPWRDPMDCSLAGSSVHGIF